MTATNQQWQFWIDRGGTFTDVVAKSPAGEIIIHKLLSENPEHYEDAPVQGIRDILSISQDQPIPSELITSIKMGTTVATNALLEHKGDRTVFVVTQGFKDLLRIAYQNRPEIFAREIVLPQMLYEDVIEVNARHNAQGEELTPVDTENVKTQLQQVFDEGVRGCAIALMHSYRYPGHELQIADIAKDIGFTQISVSHQVSPLMKIVSRGDTTVVDAYLSPILRRYIDQVSSNLSNTPSLSSPYEGGLGGISPNDSNPPKSPLARGTSEVSLMFMQSNGGLTDATQFQGKDSILSGPAGGIVGAVKTSQIAGFDKIISFDMGGTSTDVAHYNGEYERTYETEIAGVRLRTPMMSIHTVAAGGGSIVRYDGARYRVGPDSAGANPGPACYGKGGELTVTDCNVLVGKIQPDFFPKVFGENADSPLDTDIVKQKFHELTDTIGDQRSPEEIASGFLAIAVDTMANAIKKISLERGYDISKYTLCCFGGAGGQHACLIADALGIKQILIHPYAGVLSAYGIGLADIRVLKQKSIETKLDEEIISQLEEEFETLTQAGEEDLASQNVSDVEDTTTKRKVHLKYKGTDSTLLVEFGTIDEIIQQFEEQHQQRYGFTIPGKELVVESITLELIAATEVPPESTVERQHDNPPQPVTTVQVYTANQWHNTPVFQREDLQPGDTISSPTLIIEATGTNVIELGWEAKITELNHLLVSKVETQNSASLQQDSGIDLTNPDPVMLEIFNNLFRSIAEQMGTTLQNTSYSVNIKERLDFSCAIFDNQGQLVANAPHIPVHLGSMSESVQSLIDAKGEELKPGDVYVLNNPYNGGTHLPDITVITPVFIQSKNNQESSNLPLANRNDRSFSEDEEDGRGIKQSDSDENQQTLQFYVASRGHHADIGGITPGSMPPDSTLVTEEGVLLDNFQLVENGEFREQELLELLTTGDYPVRNPDQNIADLQAQIAANKKGVKELNNMVAQFGLEVVQTYMQFVQDNAEASVRKAIDKLKNGHFTCELDTGDKIQVEITINPESRSAKIDFTGTSPQMSNNFNAPKAICKAAVLYVFRTLVEDNIPLNQGCLKPLETIFPEGSLLNPTYPAAVVAGNVETSQNITDCLYGALGVMAASQGTMNNFTFGNENHQYYETICGGSGAGVDFDGTDGVHTHMTNSRITDPEVLEWRFPVLLEKFAIRPESGGKGKHSGGKGVIRRMRFLEPMKAAILSSRRRIAPFGLEGGEAGKPGKNYVQRQDGSIEELGSTATVEMNVGDVFVIETPGGGGYG
jgi:5-oxoprolinase (ATP-hydrolysing)